MREVLQVRFGEIFLKGLNRPVFLRKLVGRVRAAVQEVNGHVWLSDSRVYVSDMTDMDEAIRRVTKVFGVHSVCRAIEMEKGDFNAICEQAVEMLKDCKGSFKVNARRSDKRYPLDSPAINMELGGYILEHLPDLHVDIKNPDVVMSVEIRDMAYLYTHPIMAVGGMPVGSNGKATLLLSGGIDSPVAGWMIAKRGVQISAVHFHSYPYTSDRALEKVLTNIQNEYPEVFEQAPKYAGVQLLDASAVVLRFNVATTEANFFPATRRLNREMKCLFDDKGIEIPFNQIVVHQAK